MPVYVFAGPDRGRIKDGIEKLYATIAKSLGEKPERIQYYGGEDSLEPILVTLKNLGLFSSHTFAVVHQAESLGIGEVKALKAYTSKPSEQATLVLVSDDTKVATDKLSFIPKDRVKVFYEMSEGEKRGFIVSTLERRNTKIDPEALDYLAELLSTDTADITSQCSMLCDSTTAAGHITIEHVETYVFHSREETVYTLFELLMEGDLGASLESLHKIIQSQESEPVGVVLGLQWQYRSLLSLKETGQKHPDPEAFKARRIYFKRSQQTFQRGLDRLNHQAILGAVHSLARYDRLIREARAGSHGIVLEMLMYELCSNREIPMGNTEPKLFVY